MQTFKFVCPTQNKVFYGAIVAVRALAGDKALVELDEPWSGNSINLFVDIESGCMATSASRQADLSDFIRVEDLPHFKEACNYFQEHAGEADTPVLIAV